MFTPSAATMPARGLFRLAVVALATLGLLVSALAGSTPAHAATGLPPVTKLTSMATGFALDSNFDGSVYGISPNTGRFQKWIVVPSDNDTVVLRNSRTAFCLDSNTEGHAYTSYCNGGSFQKWTVFPSDFGSVVLQNLATGLVLDGNGEGTVYTHDYNKGSYQKWFPVAA